jgi:Zn-dependent protease
MFDRGYLTLLRVRGVPVRAHWSLPLAMLLVAGLRVAPGAWLGVLLVVVLHELGHAYLVHRVGLVNLGIDLTGFGGRCRWAGAPSPRDRSLVAWGGVLAQLVVLAGAAPLALWLVPSASPFVNDLLDALTRVNLFLIVLNLIPFPPLDGAEAWPFLGHWRSERRRKRAWKDRLSRPAEEPREPETLREALARADRDRSSGSGEQ